MTRLPKRLFALSPGAITIAVALAAATTLPAADPKPPVTTRTTTTTTTRATTSPAATVTAATVPAVAAAPLTPKAVALAFAASVEKGDAEVAGGLLPDEPARLQWLKATIELVAAVKKLDAAAVARFGEPGKLVSQDQLHQAESFKSLERAQEKVEGDAATLTVPGQSQPLQLKKVAGKWQLQIGPAPADVPAQLELYRRLIDAATRTAAEIAEGACPTPQAAAKVFAARVLSARAG